MNDPSEKGDRGRAARQDQHDSDQSFANSSPLDPYINPSSSGSGPQDAVIPDQEDEGRVRPGNLAQETVNAVKGLAQSVTAQASDLASNIGQELTSTTEARVASGADALRGFAKAMKTAAQELDAQSPQVARHMRDAAGQVEAFSDTIRNRKVGDLLNAASDLARSQPTAFITGAVVAGFALARFFKSSGASPIGTVGEVAETVKDAVKEEGLSAESVQSVANEIKNVAEASGEAVKSGAERILEG